MNNYTIKPPDMEGLHDPNRWDEFFFRLLNIEPPKRTGNMFIHKDLVDVDGLRQSNKEYHDNSPKDI